MARKGSKPNRTKEPTPGASELIYARSAMPTQLFGPFRYPCLPKNVRYNGRGTRIVRPRGGCGEVKSCVGH